MPRADVLMVHPLGLLSSVGKRPLALVTERQIYQRGNLYTGVLEPLSSNYGGRRPWQKMAGTDWPPLVLPKQPQQQVFRLDVGAAVLARLIARIEYGSPRLLGVALEHTRNLPYPIEDGSMLGSRAPRALVAHRSQPECFAAACWNWWAAVWFCPALSHVSMRKSSRPAGSAATASTPLMPGFTAESFSAAGAADAGLIQPSSASQNRS